MYILQNKEDITVFNNDMRYSFRFYNFKDMEPQWSFSEDDPTNDIYDIFVDIMNHKQVDLYILYSNATLKKFTAVLEY